MLPLISDIQSIKISDYDYCLPDEKIPQFPIKPKDASKLLIYNKGKISQSIFKNLTDYFDNDSLIIFNNSKVYNARLLFEKNSGAKIEVFLIQPLNSSTEIALSERSTSIWHCIIGNQKRWKSNILSKHNTINGQEVTLRARLIETSEIGAIIEFSWTPHDIPFSEILQIYAQVPLPPYIKRQALDSDSSDYQTVYADILGSVAAPTAGLHFTEELLINLIKKNIICEYLTLHVNLGTFKPVNSETIINHNMHSEFISFKLTTIKSILKNLNKNITAVGTTSARSLESLYWLGVNLINQKISSKHNPAINHHIPQWLPYNIQSEKQITAEKALEEIIFYCEDNNYSTFNASTSIIIVPGYNFRIVKKLITNFHQPRSTLLLLIAAFIGSDWKKIYNFALNNDFRFLSYGDSSLLIP